MMDADFQLAQQIQTEEQEQLSIEEKSKLFVELLEKRKKHFAALRAKEKRNKPPTKTQKINTMSTYLKNMDGLQNTNMDTELVKGSKTEAEGSSKRAGEVLKSDNSKKQKIDKHVEAKGDDDQEEAEMKKHIEIVQDDEEDLNSWKLVNAKYGNTRERNVVGLRAFLMLLGVKSAKLVLLVQEYNVAW
ncbi:hypothetical protein Tco_1337780 [Tanacetum coccineum]